MQPVCDDFFVESKAPSGPSSAHLNPFIRAYLDEVRNYLLKLHDEGAPASRVNEEHAELIDRLIRKLFRLTEDHYFKSFPRLDFRLAVIATGGYGRRELSLASDIDLLFLFRGKLNPYVETIAEALPHRLWDARLQVADVTRTIQDCMRVGKSDLPTMTSLLDARFLIGDPGLFAELEGAVRAWMKENADEFIRGKLEEQRDRHERFGESLYLLQPNVRESVGGLRDYQTSLWIARAAVPDVRRADHLRVHGFIDGDEFQALNGALEFFWRVRNELHRNGRKDDRLHFEAQERLAEFLGLRGTDEILAVEALMRRYYLHARDIERVNRRVLAHAAEVRRRRRGVTERSSHSVAEGFAIVDERLEIPDANTFEQRPMRLLAAFAVAQHHDVELSPRALNLIRHNLHRVDDAFRRDPEAADFFRRILSSPVRVYRTLRTMNEIGLLGAYLPEFGRLVGMWQQDMYHTYTVDAHSLFLVEQLRRIVKGLYRKELRLPTALLRQVGSPWILYLSAMLHDIGKGLGGGHSGKGARLVPAVAERLGLDEEQTETVTFLVLHHLTMSGMAEQRDVNDHRLILNLAQLAETRERLRLLYLLTVADIRSVSKEAWTSWKAGLLERLYRNTAEWFETDRDREEAEQFFLERAMQTAHDAQESVLQSLAAQGADPEMARALLDLMPRRYLLEHEAEHIAAHAAAALDFVEGGRDLGVYTFGGTGEDDAPFWGVIVLARDRPGLFSTVAGVLSACRHPILAAHAYTTRNGNAMEVYKVAPIPGGPDEEAVERERIEEKLRAALAGGRVDVSAGVSPQPRALRELPPRVHVTNDDSDFYTIIDVATNDRPALLYDITRTLSGLGLEIVASHASTRANRAVDAFSVTDRGRKIGTKRRRKQVEEALLEAIRQSV